MRKSVWLAVLGLVALGALAVSRNFRFEFALNMVIPTLI